MNDLCNSTRTLLAILICFIGFIANAQSNSEEVVYMNTSFLDSIHNAQSCYKFREFDPSFFGFRLTNNSLSSFYKHEHGGEYIIELNQATSKFQSTNKGRSSFKGEQLKSDAVILEMKGITTFYSPYPDVEIAIRQQFFNGKFVDAQNKEYMFNPWNGSITGFGHESVYYQVVYDFGLGIDFDCITIFRTINGGNWDIATFYHFKVIDKNTIELYKVKTDFEKLNHSIDSHPLILKKKL